VFLPDAPDVVDVPADGLLGAAYLVGGVLIVVAAIGREIQHQELMTTEQVKQLQQILLVDDALQVMIGHIPTTSTIIPHAQQAAISPSATATPNHQMPLSIIPSRVNEVRPRWCRRLHTRQIYAEGPRCIFYAGNVAVAEIAFRIAHRHRQL
jgi:hypothetical protein